MKVILLLVAWTLSSIGAAADISEWPPSFNAAPDTQALELVRSRLANKEDHLERTVKRLGNRTIELELFVATVANYKTVREVFSDVPMFGSWGLKNINKKPSGGDYYLKFHSMEPKAGDLKSILAHFALELPLYKRNMVTTLRFDTEQRPASFVLKLKSKPESESPVGTIEGYLHFFPAPGRENLVWLHAVGHVVLNSGVMYELLPEKLLQRESGDRLRIILDNYLGEEERRHLSIAAKRKKPTP